MFARVVAVNSQVHASVRVREIGNFSFAAGTHFAYLTMQEFARAASIYSVVFLEDKAVGGFRPVALLGLEPEQNVFVDGAGKWLASYIAAVIRR